MSLLSMILYKKKKKKMLANLVPTIWWLPFCCCYSVLPLKSSLFIPTLKSCSVLTDPLVQARDSWILGRVDHKLSSRGGGGEGRERQGRGKWEFAPHASRVSVLICHSTTADQFWILMSEKKLKCQMEFDWRCWSASQCIRS